MQANHSRFITGIAACLAVVVLLSADVSQAATISYDANNIGSSAWSFTTLPGPIAGDLGESATVSLVDGTTAHGASGPLSNLTDGDTASDGSTGETFFIADTAGTGKIEMSWDSAQGIGTVRSYSFQNYIEDRRFPQVYKLYGTLDGGAGVDDASLASDWTLLADVDSRSMYTYDDDVSPLNYTTEPFSHPQQIVVSIAGINASYSRLLFRIDPASSSDQAPFLSEFDVIMAPVPEPSTAGLLFGLCIVGMAARRRQPAVQR